MNIETKANYLRIGLGLQKLVVEFKVIRLGTRTDVTEEFDKLYG